MSKVELDFISDVDMYLFFKKIMRDGVSYISKRYSQANNKHLTMYDPKKATKYITHLDKTNLYSHAMPMGKFK